jgi:hypothetical protein
MFHDERIFLTNRIKNIFKIRYQILINNHIMIDLTVRIANKIYL